MIMTFEGLPRPVETYSFSDIVPLPVLRFEWVNDRWELEFDGTLTARQEWLVRIRIAAEDAATEQMMVSLLDSYTDLRQIRNTTGTLSSANLSAAVRALAAAQVRMMRLMFGDTAGPAE